MKASDDGKAEAARQRKPARRIVAPAQAGVGGALRSVYDEAVSEDIPQEMLDLLGKLD